MNATTRVEDEKALTVLTMRKAGYQSRTIAAATGYSADYIRALASRIVEADVKAHTGNERRRAQRYWGLK